MLDVIGILAAIGCFVFICVFAGRCPGCKLRTKRKQAWVEAGQTFTCLECGYVDLMTWEDFH